MGLWLPPAGFGYLGTNLIVSDRNGSTVTASATPHVKGAWASLIDPVPEDVYGISVKVGGIAGATTVTSLLLDIGAGPTGGGSEYVVLEDLDCWGAPAVALPARGKTWFFPVFIPKGERLSARSQAVIASDNCSVAVNIYGGADGWAMGVPKMWERLGAVTDSNGPSVTAGSGAFGSWAAVLDPITKPYRWWHVGMGALADTSILAGDILVELGIGETTAAVTTIGSWCFGQSASEDIAGPDPSIPVYQPLPNDTANGIFARICGTETEARSIFAYGGQ